MKQNTTTQPRIKQKIRFDGLDVAAMTAHIHRTLLGNKLANVYDGAALSTSSTDSGGGVFLFKLANPSANATTNRIQKNEGNNSSDTTLSNRVMLLVESGVRFHTTAFYGREQSNHNNAPPSQFAMKLRKHLRNLRLENITQLGNLDRVVDLRFGAGEYAHHVILEMYGLGNLILTNCRYEILALLRVHEYNVNKDSQNDVAEKDNGNHGMVGGEVKVRVGNVYPVTYATTITTGVNVENKSIEDQTFNAVKKKLSLLEMNQEEAYQWAKHELLLLKQKSESESNKENQSKKKQGKKNKKNDGSCNVKMLLLKPSSGVFHYGPSLLEHCILSAKLEPSLKFTLETSESVMPPDAWGALLKALKNEGCCILQNFHRGDGGYVLYRKKTSSSTSSSSTLVDEKRIKIPHFDKIFEEFQPHLLLQHSNCLHLKFNSFTEAVDEFYSLLEGQKRALRAEAAEATAKDRLAKIRRNQSQRIETLERSMESLRESAQLVELHADDIDKALSVINSAADVGMDWEALEELVQVEKSNGNPIALLIKSLKLENDEIVLSIPDTMNWDRNSGCVPHIVDITVSLNQSAHGNARVMYDQYRSSKEKADKTLQASQMALAAAETNAQRQIEAAQQNKTMTYSVMMQPQRRSHWFEKFNWFVTSDNYLVLGGRDAQQNEILVKRYLRPGDAYLHADVHGAPTCILRAKRRRTDKGATEVLTLSNQALQEAGNFAICRSSAWASRMVTSAWWVESHQVSKTAPTGEYLTVGSFMIRGKKNFLPATQLEMGLGVMFRLGDETSVTRHTNERRDFALMALDNFSVEGDEKSSMTESLEKSTGKTEIATNDDDLLGNDDKLGAYDKVGIPNKERPIVDEASNRAAEVKNDISGLLECHTADRAEKEVKAFTLDESNEGTVALTQVGKTKKKKGLSARDRKLVKRYGSLEAAEKALAQIKLEEQRKKTSEALISKDQNIDNESEVKPKVSFVRGKKSKLKKIAKKYGDQDEEDRELAIFALQGGGKQDKKKKGGRTKVESLNQIEVANETTALLVRNTEEVVKEKLSPEVRAIIARCVRTKGTAGVDGEKHEIIRWDKLDAEVLEQLIELGSLEAQLAAANRLLNLTETTRVDNFSSSLAGIIRTVQKYGFEGIQPIENELVGVEGKQRKTRAEKAAEKEVWREILAEDGIIEDDGDNDGGPVDDTAEMNKLTGSPVPNDVLLYALPICAPYHTLRNYMYRVKLTPGNQRRGKASKQCLEMFYRTDSRKGDRKVSNLHEMIKAVSVNDWSQTICGDVKISGVGATKVIKNQKAKGKKGKKNK